jgi:hypothetical protein
MFSDEQGRKWCVTMFPYFATGVVDTGGKISIDINKTIAKLVEKFATGGAP